MSYRQQPTELLNQSLQELGLTAHEIDLYCLSLRLGPTPPTKLAAELNITRPNIYKVIAGLEKHGLCKFSNKKRSSKNFMVEPPTAIIQQLRQKQEMIKHFDHDMTESLPDLLALYQQGELPTSIRIFEGQDQFQKLFFQTIDEAREEMLFFGSDKDFRELVPWKEHREWIIRRQRKGLRIKALFLPNSGIDQLQKNDPDPLREMRYLKNISPFQTMFQIYANKMIIWQPKAAQAILIEDQYIIAMQKAIFYQLWEANAP